MLGGSDDFKITPLTYSRDGGIFIEVWIPSDKPGKDDMVIFCLAQEEHYAVSDP